LLLSRLERKLWRLLPREVNCRAASLGEKNEAMPRLPILGFDKQRLFHACHLDVVGAIDIPQCAVGSGFDRGRLEFVKIARVAFGNELTVLDGSE
jgi:hypothetical protein